MTPGIKTSEGRMALLKVLVSSAIAICTAFGIAVPGWLQPDAPWVTVAALAVGGLVTVFYSQQRTALKRTVALKTPVAVEPAAPAPAVPVAPAADAGVALIGLIGAIVAAIGAIWLILGAVHHQLDVIGLILLVIGVIILWFDGQGRRVL